MTTWSNKSIGAIAHTNIALIKYWGKKDESLIIPYTSSLSLTLDQFYTETHVTFDESLTADVVMIDEQEVNGQGWQRVHDFLSIIRNRAEMTTNAQVVSTNHVPTAAGLASSASAFAALAAAGSKAAGLDLSHQDLSRLARRGSGSACRSIYGGFVEWRRGTDDHSSYAVPVTADNGLSDVQVIALTVERHRKPISSRQAMRLSVTTSPYYPTWVKIAQTDLAAIKSAISNDDFTKFGEISELNAMRMHALTLSANPDFMYFNNETLESMNMVKQLRHNGIECYYTIDAGPNVKVLCQRRHVNDVVETFTEMLGADKVTLAKSGPGVHYL